MIDAKTQLSKTPRAKFLTMVMAMLISLTVTYAREAQACWGWGSFCLDSIIKTSLACAVPSPVCLVEVIQAGSTDTARLATFLYKDVYSDAIQFFYNCTDQDLGGKAGACFPNSNNFDSAVGYYQTLSTVPGMCPRFDQFSASSPINAPVHTHARRADFSHDFDSERQSDRSHARGHVHHQL